MGKEKQMMCNLSDSKELEKTLDYLIQNFDALFLDPEIDYLSWGSEESGEFVPHVDPKNLYKGHSYCFFSEVAKNENLRPKMVKLLGFVIDETGKRGKFDYILCRGDFPVGFLASFALLMEDMSFLPLHLQLMRNLDLEHIDADEEIALVDALLDRWGITPEICHLLAARTISITTQSSYNHVDDLIDEKYEAIRDEAKWQQIFLRSALEEVQYNAYFLAGDMRNAYNNGFMNALEIGLQYDQYLDLGRGEDFLAELDFSQLPDLTQFLKREKEGY